MFLKTCRGEMIKQGRNYFNSWSTYISLLLWPIITFAGTFYTYASFDISLLQRIGINNGKDLAVFLITGFLCYNTFWIMVQSALFMQVERENGTLEVVFLTPASRMGILYGRSLGALFQGIWLMVIYLLMLAIVYADQIMRVMAIAPLVIALVIISAVIWGGFINSIFLISRDVDFWFNVCDEPMKLFSGIELPIVILPSLFKAISVIFPLTYCIDIIRCLIADDFVSNGVYLKYIVINIAIVSLTIGVLNIAEKNNRETGNLALY